MFYIPRELLDDFCKKIAKNPIFAKICIIFAKICIILGHNNAKNDNFKNLFGKKLDNFCYNLGDFVSQFCFMLFLFAKFVIKYVFN